LNEPQKPPVGAALVIIVAVTWLLSLVVAIIWNVGLYGAGLIDHKISFVTAIGLAMIIPVLRYTFGR
jgi:hypothetical protein